MRIALLSFVSLFLLACSTPSPAPVSDRYQAAETSPDSHRVARGDTLFSIAFRYGTTVESLAAVNGIAAPYTIYVDQRLKLKGSPAKTVSPDKASVSLASAKPSIKKPSVKVAKDVGSRTDTILHNDSEWYWPLAQKGRVTQRFKAGSSSNKGIDIVAPRQTVVRASRAGTVVYAGNSLPGYGNLLIIKHDARHLSAYAHNERLLVKEGDTVKAKQAVAHLGSTATSSPKLHFEIRRDGKPIDPMALLRKP